MEHNPRHFHSELAGFGEQGSTVKLEPGRGCSECLIIAGREARTELVGIRTGLAARIELVVTPNPARPCPYGTVQGRRSKKHTSHEQIRTGKQIICITEQRRAARLRGGLATVFERDQHQRANRKGKKRKGKERKGKEGREREGKERKGKEIAIHQRILFRKKNKNVKGKRKRVG